MSTDAGLPPTFPRRAANRQGCNTPREGAMRIGASPHQPKKGGPPASTPKKMPWPPLGDHDAGLGGTAPRIRELCLELPAGRCACASRRCGWDHPIFPTMTDDSGDDDGGTMRDHLAPPPAPNEKRKYIFHSFSCFLTSPLTRGVLSADV